MSLQNLDAVLVQARLSGGVIACVTGDRPSPVVLELAAGADARVNDVQAYVERGLAAGGKEAQVGLFVYSGVTEARALTDTLRKLPALLAPKAWVIVDDADFTSVYDAIQDLVQTLPPFHLSEIRIDFETGARAGQGLALISYDASRSSSQRQDEIPASKNKQLADRFYPASPVMDLPAAQAVAVAAVRRWTPSTEERSKQVFETLAHEFTDGASPQTYWHEAYQQGFTDFFAWGHDQDFGFGRLRQGTMSTRHVEIVSECIQYGYLPSDLSGLEVLDVGCWTGGDVLALAGMGAKVTAIEEHPVSAAAARRMCELLEVPAEVLGRSLYDDNPAWAAKFDVVYISGVIYHVTDPVLALRICFSYLKPGGRIVVETKASRLDGALCEYGGTHEKGWNWYSPTLETQGRWLVDAGFERADVGVHMRPIGRLLAGARKAAVARLPERAGFSRPNSWLESAT